MPQQFHDLILKIANKKGVTVSMIVRKLIYDNIDKLDLPKEMIKELHRVKKLHDVRYETRGIMSEMYLSRNYLRRITNLVYDSYCLRQPLPMLKIRSLLKQMNKEYKHVSPHIQTMLKDEINFLNTLSKKNVCHDYFDVTMIKQIQNNNKKK